MQCLHDRVHAGHVQVGFDSNSGDDKKGTRAHVPQHPTLLATAQRILPARQPARLRLPCFCCRPSVQTVCVSPALPGQRR